MARDVPRTPVGAATGAHPGPPAGPIIGALGRTCNLGDAATRAGVSTSSLIIATPRTNRAGVFVQSVVPGAGRFTIYLNKKVAGATGVAYMILG